MAGQPIDITTLNPEQLSLLKKDLEEEVDFLTQSFVQLRSASNKFMEAGEALDDLKKENEGKEIFIPLTSSLYVPGTLSQTSSVLIDVGTGYLIEHNIASAKDYTTRRAKDINGSAEKVQQSIEQKQKSLSIVTQVLQAKIMALQGQQAPQLVAK
jgi:prefoldin alpha subunit